MRLALAHALPMTGSGASGAGAVTLSAVRVHLDYALKYTAGAMTASPRGVLSMWLRGLGGSVANPVPPNGIGINGKYIFGQHTVAAPSAEADPGFNLTLDNSAGNLGGGVWRNNLSPPADTAHPMNGASATAPARTLWQHLLWIWDVNFAAGSKRGVFAVNGVDVGGDISGDTNGAATVGLAGADLWLNMVIGGWQTAFIADVAQVTLWTPADVSTLMTANGTFAAGAIDKFYNAGTSGPMDFGATGTTPFGVAPLVYHTGDKTTFGTNAGTIGAPTVVGTAPRANPYNYMFGPGATPDRPYEQWTVHNNASFGAEASGGPYSGILNYGGPIAVGDFLTLMVKFSNNTADAGASRNIVVNGTGWTKSNDKYLTTATGGDFAIWYKIATAGDVTAGGADWTNAPTVTWTTRGQAFARTTYTLTCWKGATTIASAISQVTGTLANGYICPSVTAPSGKSTLVSGISPWTIEFEGQPGPPSGQDLLWWPNAAGAISTMAWSAVNASGATGTSVWTGTTTGNAGAAAYQIILN